MAVVALDEEAQQLPFRAGERSCVVVDQALALRVVVDDVLPAITPARDMDDGAVKFDAKSSWHSLVPSDPVPNNGLRDRVTIRNR